MAHAHTNPTTAPPPGTPPAAPPGSGRPVLRTTGGRVTGAAVPALVPPATQGSFADVPYVNAYEAPDAVALGRRHRDGTWHDVTCRRFAAEVTAVAKGLIAHGLRPGDRLAVMSRTRYEWTLLDFAAWAAGLVTVPVFPDAPPHQVLAILHDTGAHACAVESGAEARVLAGIRHDLPALRHLWQLTAVAGGSDLIGQLAAAGAAVPDAAVAERRAGLGPWQPATIVHTSGTTGPPKGCVLTHANLFAQADNAIELLHPLFRPAPVPGDDGPPATLLFLPMAHGLGRMVALAAIRARVRLGHSAGTDADELLADLAGFRPTFLFAVPQLLERVYHAGRAAAEEAGRTGAFDRAARVARRWGAASEARQQGGGRPGLGLRAARYLYDPLVYRRIRAAFGGRVRHVLCGGWPLGRRLATFFEGAGITVYEGYGLTETTAAATVTPPGERRLGTVGRPLPGTEVRIAPDGEVLLRGSTVFAGYWDPARRQAVPATDPGGWLHTGDAGALDADGHLTVTGRKADVLTLTGGLRVAPGPLEDRLRAHPLISHCLVTGDRRPHPVALIALDRQGLAHWRRTGGGRRQGAGGDDPELRAELQRAVDDANAEVSPAEPVRAFAVLPRDLTVAAGHLTPTNKVRRAAVQRDFAREIDALYR